MLWVPILHGPENLAGLYNEDGGGTTGLPTPDEIAAVHKGSWSRERLSDSCILEQQKQAQRQLSDRTFSVTWIGKQL